MKDITKNPFYNKSHIAHLWLTRRCNLKCSYCNVIRDYKDSPYPPVSEYEELTANDWYEIIDIYAKLGTKFFLLYGAEVLVYKEINDLCYKLNQRDDIHYSIHTNGTLPRQLDELIHTIGLKGLTFSYDLPTNDDKHRIAKSNASKKMFLKYKEDCADLVVTITLDKSIVENDNIEVLLKELQWFTDHNIISIVTFIDHQRNQWYDFSNVPWTPENKIPVNERFHYLLQKLKEGHDVKYKLHNYKHYWEELPGFTTDENFFCVDPFAAPTIDADGTIRLCSRIKGNTVTAFKPQDIISNPENVMEAYMSDYKTKCVGCAWDCAMQSSQVVRGISSKEKVDKEFTH